MKWTIKELQYESLIEDSETQICLVYGRPENNKKLSHLISAAPELFKMLKEVLFTIEHGQTSDNKLHSDMEIKLIKEAISKAKGETND